MQTHFLTSESVTEGHPDKLCDQISDGILDAYLEQDPKSRVAVETLASSGVIFIAGEVTSTAKVDVPSIVKKIVREIGYTSEKSGLNIDDCLVFTNIHTQSKCIAKGVDADGHSVGAGDQGIMYGFACDENEAFMPMTHSLATKLCIRLAEVRKSEIVPWLFPDGKSQVTMVYENGKPGYISSIVVSAHHDEKVSLKSVRECILNDVICPVIDSGLLSRNTIININPAGTFSLGGPAADTGLTGRKIMVDTYGSIGKHGGGAFSGKDPTKVDRSAAYMARYVAKNIVAAGLASRCEVSLAYAIGCPEPEAISIDTFGTEQIPIEMLKACAKDVFSYSVQDIISQLDLQKPQYRKSAAYGHFGREDQGFQWEKTDKLSSLRESVVRQYIQKSTD